MVGSQTANLTSDPAFGHNLCFECPNESCEPILDIYVLRAFQWYKEIFNPMRFDPCNFPLKIWTPIPKVGVHLGVWEFIPSHSHSFTFLGSLLAHTFISLCLKSGSSFGSVGVHSLTLTFFYIPGLTLSPHLHKPLL
jgi:hypothetical protein